MCDPVSFGTMALGAAGQAITGYEANRNAASQIEARNAATQAELERQRKYGAETQPIFQKSLDIYSPTNQTQGLANAQSTIGDALTANRGTNFGSITTTSAPRVVADSEAARLGKVTAFNDLKSDNMAKLKGYGQQTFDNKVALNSNARDIDTIGDFSKTSAGVNQVEQRAAAQNAARAPSGIGSMLSFLGTVGANRLGRGGSIFPTYVPGGGAPATGVPGISGVY